MDLKAMGKAVEKYNLSAPMTLDELYELMNQRWAAELPGAYKLKKGLFGKSILFDVYMQVQPKITVKGNLVTCRKMNSQTTVSSGGLGIDLKASKQYMAAMKEGGLKKAVSGGPEYFHGVCDALREVLKDKIA